MTRLLVATTNPGKLREIRDLLADVPVTLIGLTEMPPVEEPEETGATFQENARLKALYYDARFFRLPASALRATARSRRSLGVGGKPEATGMMATPEATGMGEPEGAGLTVAEDSGLVIDALDGEPGVRSARFLRPEASYAERFSEIFRRLAERPHQPRTARFVCALALARDGRIIYETTGRVEGEIAHKPSGTGGFGYDPIFYYPPYRLTLADVTQEEKIRVAHRGIAFRKLAAWLELRLQPSAEPSVQAKNGER